MTGKHATRGTGGNFFDVTDPKVATSYCEGRTGAKASVTLAKATVITGLVASNNSILFTPARYGNGFTVRIIDPGAISRPLRVVTGGVGSTILDIYVATDAGGVITSTAALVITAVNAAVSGLNILTSCANNGASTGAGLVTVETQRSTGGTPNAEMGQNTDAYVNGHGSWTADPAGKVTVDCCDLKFGGGFAGVLEDPPARVGRRGGSA